MNPDWNIQCIPTLLMAYTAAAAPLPANAIKDDNGSQNPIRDENDNPILDN